MTKICCVCQRVEYKTYWKDDYTFAPDERVTHGYCPICFDVVMSDLMDYIEDNDLQGGKDGGKTESGQQNSLCA